MEQSQSREKMRDGIVKRGNSYSYVVTKDGKHFWKGGFSTRAEAKAERAKALVSLSERKFVEPSKVLLSDFLTRWIETHSRSLKPKTAANYLSHINNYVIPNLGQLRVQEIRPSDLEKYFGILKDRGGRNGRSLSSQTVAYHMAILKRALDYAVSVEKLIGTNPAADLTIHKGKSRVRKVWSFNELEIFLGAVRSHRLYFFYHLAAYTGARRGELLALRWSDFDGKAISVSKSRVQAGSITIDQNSTKGGENGQRRVILDSVTIAEFNSHRKRQVEERLRLGSYWTDSGYVFVQEDGNPLYVTTPTQHFRRVCEREGLLGMNLHGLRHLHATELLRLGEPLHVVAQRLGHRDAMVTATIYAHVSSEQGETAASRFAEAATRR